MCIKLAINYSLQAADLLSDGSITIDRLKCPDWPELIDIAASYAPIYIHFSLHAGSGTLADTNWEPITTMLAQTNTPYVNVHLAPQTTDFPGMPLNTTNRSHVNAIIDRLIQDTAAAVEQFGPERVIAENVPFNPSDPTMFLLRPAADPRVISRVIRETGCGLLLDTSHARIAAQVMGMDEREYLSLLPIDHLRELHVTGLSSCNGYLDDHLPMTEEDWSEFEWALSRIQQGDWPTPWIIAFEYGGVGVPFEWRTDIDVIAEQVPRFYELMHAEKGVV